MSISAIGIAPTSAARRSNITTKTVTATSASLPAFDPKVETPISGPYTLFSGSCVFEFLKPAPWRNASVLIKGTYKMGDPMWKTNPEKHPQLPPLHLHFNQDETFQVLQGTLSCSIGYEQQLLNINASGTYFIPKMLPHIVGPPIASEDNPDEDVIVVVWAHPKDTVGDMDHIWFLNLFRHVSDAQEGKAKLDIEKILMMQHESESTLVVAPGIWWLGSLRWRIPYYLQAAVVAFAKLRGKQALSVDNNSKLATE